MTVYRIRARFGLDPLVPDWRAQLALRLGVRPRRMGIWAELGLYGALECLAAAGEDRLAERAALLVSSRLGPVSAMHEALAQVGDGLPLPLAFLQIQPSQLLAALSAQLGWSGDARFVTQADPCTLLALALAMADERPDGLLLGWVQELATPSSLWLRLQPSEDPGGVWQACGDNDFATLLRQASHLRTGRFVPEVIIDPLL